MIQAMLLVITLQQVAGDGAVRGVVLSRVDSTPLQGAVIQIPSGRTTATGMTDAHGFFLISGMAPGSYALTVRLIGYPAYRQQISIAANDTLTVMVRLGGRCEHDSVTAMRDVARKRPFIFLQGGNAPLVGSQDARMQRRYGFEYVEFGDVVYEPMECLKQYNRVVARFLDSKFGTVWRDSVRY
jgi:carboxypeptidase family protein